MSAKNYYSLHFYSIFLFCTTVIQLASFATSTKFIVQESSEQRDRVALQAFKKMITHDTNGFLNSWNDSHHFCEWEGITCGRRHRRVTVLDLNSKGLSGSLSPYVGNLSFLREISLYNNSITGEIPHEFERLSRLEVLLLFNNSLTGEIPANLSYCSRLKTLSLGSNKLVGNIPIEFDTLHDLNLLAVHNNNLRGGIPSFLGNITSLVGISLAFNSLGGNIPHSLGQLKELTFLGLGSNNINGTVPLSIYNLSLLDTFAVASNLLHGNLPPNLGLSLPNLKHFQISQNFLRGSIPVSLSNASKLEVIDMSKNYFSGKLSVDFGGMKQLSELYVGKNNLENGEGDEMKFMNSLVNCSNLRNLHIEGNKFRGALPHSIVNLSPQLKMLFIGINQFDGTIPEGISNLVNIEILDMGANQLIGTIPKEIGKLQKIRLMDLSQNKLSGEIPSSLGNLSLLDKLDLDGNKLSGVIPSSLGKLKQLTILVLFNNELSGIIPKEIFKIASLSVGIDLSKNHFVGSIPPDVSNLKAVSIFDVSDNSLSGELPSELGICSSLEGLYMQGNFFYGSIPSSLSSLRGIQYIDLSRNNLSGQIPKFLETLSLLTLNLSYNNFEGEVPKKGIFGNASAISVVGNRNRLCGGIAELRLPKCANDHLKKQKISREFKIVISTASAFSGFVLVSFFIVCLLRKRRGKQPTGSTRGKALLRLSYESLLKATGGFSSTHLLGVGGYGSVYKGILDQEKTVAVKVLNLQVRGASKSFMAECKALSNIRHRNLVRVITSCSSTDFQGNDFKALVYQYMPNGSLEKWLHPASEPKDEELEVHNLTLLQRINIGIDVASAIDYLHNHIEEPILHCDLKPSNVLLDGDMTAHVGDFGLARFRQEVSNPNQSSSVGVRGTIGYAAPEYGLGSEVSTNGDVYSFGILLLEMVTRKKPVDGIFEEDLNLHRFARIALPDRVLNIVDPTLLNDEDLAATNHRQRQIRINGKIECLISVVRIAVACSMESPQDRMNITDVVHELKSIKKILLEPGAVHHRERGQI